MIVKSVSFSELRTNATDLIETLWRSAVSIVEVQYHRRTLGLLIPPPRSLDEVEGIKRSLVEYVESRNGDGDSV